MVYFNPNRSKSFKILYMLLYDFGGFRLVECSYHVFTWGLMSQFCLTKNVPFGYCTVQDFEGFRKLPCKITEGVRVKRINTQEVDIYVPTRVTFLEICDLRTESLSQAFSLLSFLFLEIDKIAQIQCTSPCLHPWHLQGPARMMREEGFDSVFAVSRNHLLRWREVKTQGIYFYVPGDLQQDLAVEGVSCAV